MSRPAALEKRLGHKFRAVGLLQQALSRQGGRLEGNERLEFLGDEVLGCVISEVLYHRYPTLHEGDLHRLKESLIREEALFEAAQLIGLDALLKLANPTIGASTLADTMEAVFGAVFLDGGYASARKTILLVFAPQLDRLDPNRLAKNAKSQLQEILQAKSPRVPEYRLLSTRGEEHSRSFEVECVVHDLGLRAAGTGTSRQRAEQAAAQAVLAMLGKA